ncbi:MAG: hypothetical protein ACR2HF_10265 [Methylococcaceae bacterium]
MFFSSLFFRVVLSVPFVLLFNTFIIAILIYLARNTLTLECITMAVDLQFETVSAILVMWGVVLESRYEITKKLPGYIDPLEHDASLLTTYGISLVALGLVVEVIDYLNKQFYQYGVDYLVREITFKIEWVILIMILLDSFAVVLRIFYSAYLKPKASHT